MSTHAASISRSFPVERDGERFVATLRRYFAVILSGNLLWEFAQMPLYTIWNTGTAGEIVFAAVHCTGGDLLIATAALVAALLAAGTGWPTERATVRRVVALTDGVGDRLHPVQRVAEHRRARGLGLL